MMAPAPTAARGRPPRSLLALLAGSWLLRIALAMRGGQWFWPDEARYGSAQDAAYSLLHGHWRDAGRELLGRADHLLYRWASLPAALIDEGVGPNGARSAALLSLYSVLAVALIWAVARRAGAGPREALWAAYLAACADSLFYYSRHFFPYDAGLCGVLAALWLALGPASALGSFLAGAAAGIGFLTYNGYWLPAGGVLALHVLLGAGGARLAWRRAACAAAGLGGAIAAVVGAGSALGYDLVAEYRMYGSIVKGDFGLGHRVVAQYLWHAERGTLAFWLAAWTFALAAPPRPRRLAWYAGGAALVAGGLVLFSDVVPQFMVQGRLVRATVPFLCLGAAAGVERFLLARGAGGAAWGRGLALVAALLAAANFARPFGQVFPDRFDRMAAEAAAARPGFHAYAVVFDRHLWGAPLAPPAPAGEVVLRRAQPLQFRPYQYEGYAEADRAELNGSDISMRLIELPAGFPAAGSPWDGYPGPLRMTVRFPRGRSGRVEPLVTAGGPGRADFFFVRYADEGHVVLGLDQWGGGATFSAPLAVDYDRPHRLVVSGGSLLPPTGSACYRSAPGLEAWRRQLLFALDGRIVFLRPQDFSAPPPAWIHVGINLAGGSLVLGGFSGRIEALEPVRPSALGPVRPVRGPLRLDVRFPSDRAGRREPLIVTGVAGRADLLSVRYVDSGHVRFGLDHWGRAYDESPVIALDLARPHRVEIALPTLDWPAPADGGEFPGRLAVSVDGVPAWSAELSFYRSAPETLEIAANRIGGSTCDPAFTGSIGGLEDVPAP